jgi:O-antigen/teichoic acid export membrane protein
VTLLRDRVKNPNADATAAGPTSRRAGLTLLDQGVSSGSNFAVTVGVARLMGAAGLGYFSFAYAAWQLLSSLHRAVVTDPMTLTGDIRSSMVGDRIRRGMAAELVLGAAGALVTAITGLVLVATGQRGYGTSMLAIAPWLPVLLIQDYWRWIGFMSRRPGRSLLNDTIFNCVQGGAFGAVFLFHVHSIEVIVAAWGVGGLAGALWGMVLYRTGPTFVGGWSLLSERWSLSKWLAGETLLNSGANQSAIFIAAAILGPIGLGGLRAARTLVAGPSMVLMQAGGSVGLPEATHAYEKRGWRGLANVSRVVIWLGVLTTGACLAIVVIWGRTLLTLVYGASFARYEPAAVLFGISLVLVALELGPLLLLKTTRNTRWMFHIQVINVLTSLSSTIALSAAYGVDGAATATVLRCGASASGCAWYRRKARLASSPQPGSRSDGPVAGPIAVPVEAGPPRVSQPARVANEPFAVEFEPTPVSSFSVSARDVLGWTARRRQDRTPGRI